MREVMAVGAGGFLGAVCCYKLTAWARLHTGGAAFPAGTLAVNLLGCLAVGVLGGLAERGGVLGADARRFLIAGFLSGFTTFSAFGYEAAFLLRDQRPGTAVLYTGLSVAGGLLAVWLGLWAVGAWPGAAPPNADPQQVAE